jgi:hypothetical protein
MSDQQSNRAAYLKQAEACMEVAERMSLLDDRVHMLRMAQRLMEQARGAVATERVEAANEPERGLASSHAGQRHARGAPVS